MNGLENPFSGGWVARFQNEDDLLAAAKAMKEGGFSNWDVVAPFPCRAMELASRENALHFPVKCLSLWGICGALLGGVILCLWITVTQTNDPVLVAQGRISGWSSWPALVPALFEGILLGAGLGIACGLLKGASLPNWYHWVFDAIQGKGNSGEDFLIVASANGGQGVKDALESLNPLSIDCVEYFNERGGL